MKKVIAGTGLAALVFFACWKLLFFHGMAATDMKPLFDDITLKRKERGVVLVDGFVTNRTSRVISAEFPVSVEFQDASGHVVLKETGTIEIFDRAKTGARFLKPRQRVSFSYSAASKISENASSARVFEE